ncbi:inositol monophosphatase family protein [Gimesia aquarii]|uniref:Inositol-1-monophosphatase n=1 Tax=Gimesia aquarii TaxID=2527964 RepID=A0A517W1M4_9PLAN|nr:inositol monophosphatase family protein [Gimesia aquarii]QDT99147.1 Inositol-1-monophosphatase [Gimesia aquarii]
MNSTELIKTAETAARLGAKCLLDWVDKFQVSEKGRADLVTDADFASQTAIVEHISQQFPSHHMLGEEGLAHQEGESDYRWVIDPLDGTSNYVHGFPYYCVSIGLEFKGELILGVVYDPNADEMFSAFREQGATLNGEPITPSQFPSLDQAMVVASLPVGTSAQDIAVKRFLRVLPEAQTVQRTGSAALNLCYVSAGRVDGYWSGNLKPWDMAAGVLICRESGGTVTSIEDGSYSIEIPSILATNGTNIHNELQTLLAEPLF